MSQRDTLTMRAVYRWPLVLAALIAVGLASALSVDGVGRVFSWFALACPLVVIVACLVGRAPEKR